MEFAVLAEPVGEIALLTDGLQPLALHYQSREAHAPFFRPLFQRLRAAPEIGCSAHLMPALQRFLEMPTLNQRTHDDKTLILASRLTAPGTVASASADAQDTVIDQTHAATLADTSNSTLSALGEDSGDETL